MKIALKIIAFVLVIASMLSLSCCNFGEGNNDDKYEKEGSENLSLEQKWSDLVVNKGAKTVCVHFYWWLSSNIEKERKIDDEKIGELLSLFEGITLSRLDETYLPGAVRTAYSFYLFKSSLVFDENGIVKNSEWKKLKDEGLNIIVESDGYVYAETEGGWYKSDISIDYTEIEEYYNHATEFDIIYDGSVE